jgi:aminoglycoside 2'-N-acetyltransferase I
MGPGELSAGRAEAACTTRLVRATTDELNPELRASVIELCIESHGETSFERLFIHVPTGGRHVLGYHGDTLVSHAMATTRWLHDGSGRRLRTAYIDAVSTLSAHQGHGHGSAVMRELAVWVDDAEIACLETDKPGFYERLGWRLWRGPLAGLRGDERIPTPDQHGIMVLRLRLTPPMDLDGPLAVEVTGRIW